MKKIFSIFLFFLILLSAMNLTVATHYCGGKIAATKISFSAKLATCGMDGLNNSCSSSGEQINTHCCKNEVSVYALDDNYTPSYSIINIFSKSIIQVYFTPVNILLHSISTLNSIFTNVLPPGKLILGGVSLPDICVFRI
jgi:hypothetical protein